MSDGCKSYIEYDNTPELVKNLIDCWPSSLLGDSEAHKRHPACPDLGTPATRGELDSVPRYHLRSLFDLEFDDFERRYQARGPCVFGRQKTQSHEFVYEEITHKVVMHSPLRSCQRKGMQTLAGAIW